VSKYRITERRFIYPFNFVSIDEPVARSKVLPEDYGELSGKISCELKTLTPLFIPNTTKKGAFGNKNDSAPAFVQAVEEPTNSYDFFSYEDLTKRDDYFRNPARPIIPGSSLRGAIRSAYEAVVNGCLSSCDDENTLYRRTVVPRKHCGIIEKDPATQERVLYKASLSRRYVGADGAGRTNKTGEAVDGGVYLRGENIWNGKSSSLGKTTKINDAVMKYVYDSKEEKIEVARFKEDGKEWENLVEVWRLYQHRGKGEKIRGVNQHDDPAKTNYHGGYKGYLDADLVPVYYTRIIKGNALYMSPAAITKEVFSRTLKQMLKEQGDHAPCTDSKELCPACALFGMVGEESGVESCASRLMFRDAVPIAPDGNTAWNDWYGTVRTLPILSSPKVTATELYQEEVLGAEYYNYDYSVKYYDDGTYEPEHVRTLLDKPNLRGRKFYWHRKSAKLDNTSAYASQRTRIRPVDSDRIFKFELYFDRLSEPELKSLLWVLTFGEDRNGPHAHKLGHGKPVGYGSVRITKADVTLIKLDDSLSLIEEKGEYKPQPPAETEALREYLAITDFSKATDEVNYPSDALSWFKINKEIRLNRSFKPSYNYILPKALDEDRYLPEYEAGDGDIGGNRKGAIEAASGPEPEPEPEPEEEPKAFGTSIRDRIKAAEAEKKAREERSAVKKKDYNKKKLEQACGIALAKSILGNEKKNLLCNFIKDYESDPEYYKSLKHLYEKLGSQKDDFRKK